MHVHKLTHTVLDICVYIYIFVNVLDVCKKVGHNQSQRIFFSCLFLFFLGMCLTWDKFFSCFVLFSFLFALRSPRCCNVLSAILFLSPYHISTTDKARVFPFYVHSFVQNHPFHSVTTQYADKRYGDVSK